MIDPFNSKKSSEESYNRVLSTFILITSFIPIYPAVRNPIWIIFVTDLNDFSKAVRLTGQVRVSDGFASLAVVVVIGGGAAGGLLDDGAGRIGIAPGDQVVGVVPIESCGAHELCAAQVLPDFLQPVSRIVGILQGSV